MATVNEFLRYLDQPEVRAGYQRIDELWDSRANSVNQRLEQLSLPVRVVNMTSVWTTLYVQPCRYNWMLQYYLQGEGLMMSWIGTGRFIFSHDVMDRDYNGIVDRFAAAATAMQTDGW